MKSLGYAFRGITDTVKNARCMRIHLCFAFYVIIAGFVTRLSAGEWSAVLSCVGLVTALECLNTAMEKLCDAVHPGRSDGIKLAKDAAAGAVLCAAAASAAVGGLVFFRAGSLAAALGFFKARTAAAVIIVLTLIPFAFFVRGGKREKDTYGK